LTSAAQGDDRPGVHGRKRVIARELDAEPLDAHGHTAADYEAPLPMLEGDIVDAPQGHLAMPTDEEVAEPLEQAYLPEPEGEFRIEPLHDLPETMPVVDPTMLGSRRRRSSHQRLYRWTQALSFTCAGAAAAGVICTMFDEPLVGRWLAGGAIGPGIASWILSGGSDLSRRWRGWAIASLVFALVSFGMTWVHENVVEPEPVDVAPVRPRKSSL